MATAYFLRSIFHILIIQAILSAVKVQPQQLHEFTQGNAFFVLMYLVHIRQRTHDMAQIEH